jgi:hypothetical protein
VFAHWLPDASKEKLVNLLVRRAVPASRHNWLQSERQIFGSAGVFSAPAGWRDRAHRLPPTRQAPAHRRSQSGMNTGKDTRILHFVER